MVLAGYLLLVVQIALSVVTELLRRKIAVEAGHLAAPLSAAAYLVQVVIGAALLLVIGVDIIFSWRIALVVTLLAISPPLREFLQFRANEKVDAGSLAILLNLTTVFTIGFAGILLDDVLSRTELIGTLLILIGAWLVARLASKGTGFTLILILLVAPLIFLDSSSNLGEAWFIDEYSLSLYLFYGLAAQAFWALVIMWIRKVSFNGLTNPVTRQPVTWYILTRATKGIMFLGAIALLDSIATVKAILAVTPVAITIAAYFALKEQDNIKTKLAAAAIASAGLIVFAI